MAMTQAERQRKSREKVKHLGMKSFRMELAASERQAVEDGAQAAGFKDHTEYLLSLVYKDRDTSQKENKYAL